MQNRDQTSDNRNYANCHFLSRYNTGENLKPLALINPEICPYGVIYRPPCKRTDKTLGRLEILQIYIFYQDVPCTSGRNSMRLVEAKI